MPTKTKTQPAEFRPTIVDEPPRAVHFLDPHDLRPNPLNVRLTMGAERDLVELTRSIQAQGVLEPLVVLPDHTVVIGHRRRMAATLTDPPQTYVPCLIREMTEAEQIAAMVAENLRRVDITPLEEANAYQTLLALAPVEDVAASVGTSVANVNAKLEVLALPAFARMIYSQGGMTDAAARELLGLAEHPHELTRLVEKELKVHGWKEGDEGWQRTVDVSLPITHFWSVKSILADIEHKAKIEKLKAEAKTRGYKVVKLPPYGFKDGDPVQINGDDLFAGSTLKLDRSALAKHKKRKCHALAIKGSELVNVCTEPGSHAEYVKPAPARTTPDYTLQRVERERVSAGLTAGAEARMVTWRSILGRPDAWPTSYRLRRLAILNRDQNCDDLLCELLGLPYGEEGDEAAAIFAYLTEDASQSGMLARADAVIQAMPIAAAEYALGDAWREWTTAFKVNAAALLDAGSHQWNEVELERWSNVKADAEAFGDDPRLAFGLVDREGFENVDGGL